MKLWRIYESKQKATNFAVLDTLSDLPHPFFPMINVEGTVLHIMVVKGMNLV